LSRVGKPTRLPIARDLGRVWRLDDSQEAGTIGIHESALAASQGAFGGLKQSVWRRVPGTEGLDAYPETKHISLGIEA